MTKKIMVIVAHPDDEVFGCGGTLLKHSMSGDEIHIVTLTDGVSSRGSSDGIMKRNESLCNVVKDLKATLSTFNFKDNELDSYSLLEIVKVIENEILMFLPSIIYTHHIGDLNIDHQICHKAVITACRPQPKTCVKEIYAFEINSSTEWNTPSYPFFFMPNYYVDITDVAYDKYKLINHYDQELREYPHIRSLEGLKIKDQMRGMQSGLENAEAFNVVRIIK